MKLNRFITGANIILVILVAIGSFSLSYSALSDLASKNGFTQWRAYILPLVIDIGMLAFGLAVVHAHLHSTNPTRRRLLNLLYTGATVVFNIVHAPNNLLAQGLAIIPPLTLFFTFEVLMAMVEYNIKQRHEQQVVTGYTAALQQAQTGFAELMQQIEDIKHQHIMAIQAKDNELQEHGIAHSNEVARLSQELEAALNPITHRRNTLLSLIQNYRAEFGQEPTQGYLAEQTGYSVQTIRKDLVALNGSVAR